MTKLRNIIFAVTLVLCGIFVGACSNTAAATEQAISVSMEYAGISEATRIYYLTDRDTNVEYIVLMRSVYGGKNVAITPRLNADGSLCCSGK